jgi:hypothetical protein
MHQQAEAALPFLEWSGQLSGDLKTHYCTCAEGVADDLLWVWLQVK